MVLTPDTPKTPKDQLLIIADHIHETSGYPNGQTTVIFRGPGEIRNRPLGRAEQFAHAFAVGRIDPSKGVREVRIGVFN